MKANVDKALQDWKRGSFDPVYLVYGEEDFIIEQLSKEMIRTALEPGTEDFNLDILYGEDVDGGKVVERALAYPMMAQRRVVVLKNMHLMSAQSISVLAQYVKKASVTTCLLLTAEKIDLRKSKLAEIEKGSTTIEARPLYDRDVPRWISGYLAERQMTISEEAMRLLHAGAGNALRSLASEIEKIALNLGERKRIEAEDVEAVIGISRQFNIFELCDAAGQKNISSALEILGRMLQMGETPVGIVAMLSRHFAILAKLKALKMQRASNDEMAKRLNLRPFFLTNYLQQLSRYNPIQLKESFSLLLEADQQLKTSYQKPKMVLENLLFRLYAL